MTDMRIASSMRLPGAEIPAWECEVGMGSVGDFVRGLPTLVAEHESMEGAEIAIHDRDIA